MEEKKYIYGLDLSMSCTGVSIFDKDGNIQFICNIPTKDKDTHGKRLKVIADKFLELKEKYPPDKIIIERAFSRFNTATAVLYRVHGLVSYLFWDVEQIYYTPKTIKMNILKGNATKKQIQQTINSVYPNIVFNCEDESDSFSVGINYFIEHNILQWNR